MMRALLAPLISLFLVNAAAYSAPRWSALAQARLKSTVKVTSGSCLGAILRLEGSGTLFSYKGRSYVLTSEHAVLHSNSGICHAVYNPESGLREPVRLIAADWSIGAALLELPESFRAIAALTLETGLRFGSDLYDKDSDLGYQFHRAVFGYPVNSTAVMQYHFTNSDMDSQFATGKAPSQFHPMAHVHLSHDVHTEFGMSGGPEFSIYGFTGMLSAMMSDWRSDTGTNAIVIERRDLLLWLQKQFEAPSVALARPAPSQLEGIEQVCTKDLVFEWKERAIHVRPIRSSDCEAARIPYRDPHGFMDKLRALRAPGVIRAEGGIGSIGELIRFLEEAAPEKIESVLQIERVQPPSITSAWPVM